MKYYYLIIIFAVTLSGCQQNIDSREINNFEAKATDYVGSSAFEVNFMIVNRLPEALNLDEGLSEFGIYLDGINVGDYNLSSKKIDSGENKIQVIVRADKQKVLAWWINDSYNENVNVTLKSDLVFNYGNALLKIIHERKGTLILPFEPTFKDILLNKSISISENYTNIAYKLGNCSVEADTCALLVNGINVTENCFVDSCSLLLIINNTKIADAFASNLFSPVFQYELVLRISGEKFVLRSERNSELMLEGK